MSDAYSADAPPVDPTPDDTEGKVTQQEANYRDGNLIYHCGLCQNFEGAANGTCTKVEGEINPYMLSDEYDGTPNPLMHKTPPRFRPSAATMPGKGARSMPPPPMAGPAEPEAPPDEPAGPSSPSLRIGRKVY